MGIEPTYLAWKASVLPLNYTRICCYEVFNVIYISRYLGMCQGGGGDFLDSVICKKNFTGSGRSRSDKCAGVWACKIRMPHTRTSVPTPSEFFLVDYGNFEKDHP